MSLYSARPSLFSLMIIITMDRSIVITIIITIHQSFHYLLYIYTVTDTDTVTTDLITLSRSSITSLLLKNHQNQRYQCQRSNAPFIGTLYISINTGLWPLDQDLLGVLQKRHLLETRCAKIQGYG